MPYAGHRTEYFVTGTVKSISKERHWRFFWKKVTVYQIKLSIEHLQETFVNVYNKEIAFPSGIKLLKGDNVLGVKKIGDSVSFTIGYADANQQFYQRVVPFVCTTSDGIQIIRA